MNIVITSVLAWLSAIELPNGTELKYTGTVSRQTASGVTEVKSFSLDTLGLETEDGHRQLAFCVDERGGGAWGWPERFGIIPLSPDLNSKNTSIRLLYTHEDQQYPLNIRAPYFEFREKLAPQATWSDGRRDYTVTRQKRINDRDCFVIDVSSKLGKVQTLTVESETGIVVSLDEKIVIGRGDEFRLKMDLQAHAVLTSEEFVKNQRVLNQLLAVQSALHRTGEQRVVELTTDQLNSLRRELPRIEQDAESTFWNRFVAAIGRDLQQQQKRLDGLALLQKKLVGQTAPEWTLKMTDGSTISDTDCKGKVVVLHFWQYRGEPLTEPYGQIGYLDFLNGKRKKLGAMIIGVNVDERFANPKQASAAIRSMKGLIDFMKVGYDMATDDGSTLAKFGDPRSTGAPLPLWIVIGHDGKITHHHTGFYNIKPDEGLKPLDDAIVEALKKKNSRQD